MIDRHSFRPASEPETPLAPGEVHLWSLDLARPEAEMESLRSLLEPSELERAERFRFPRHRRRFIVRRARLRQLVAVYQGLDPAAVRFDYGPRGKPSLVAEQDAHVAGRLEFNLSDSEDLALVALSRDQELGADVEILRAMPDALSISEHFFADGEREVLRRVPEDEVPYAFFCCWTRKEAYLKAIGEGLAVPLDRFEVTLYPAEPCHFQHIDHDPAEAEHWLLETFEPAKGAIGALAARRRDLQIGSCYRWSESGPGPF